MKRYDVLLALHNIQRSPIIKNLLKRNRQSADADLYKCMDAFLVMVLAEDCYSRKELMDSARMLRKTLAAKEAK